MKRRRNRNRKRIEITPRYFLLGLTGFCVVLMLVSLFAGGNICTGEEFYQHICPAHAERGKYHRQMGSEQNLRHSRIYDDNC